MKKIIFLSILIFVASALYGSRQSGSYSLNGAIVAEDTNQPLDYASVVVVNNNSGVTKYLQSDTLGRFTLNLTEGDYFIEISYTLAANIGNLHQLLKSPRT